MKSLFFLLFTCISGISSAQYFNISPTIYTETSTNEFHYEVTGITDFSDSLELILHADLVTDDEQLTDQCINLWTWKKSSINLG